MLLAWDRDHPPPSPWLWAPLVAIGAAALVAARIFPFSRLPTLCGFKLVTTWPCPACGMTRSWMHLAHGPPGAALAQSPLGTLLFLITAGGMLYLVLRSIGGMPAVRIELSSGQSLALRVGVVLGIALNWLYIGLAGVG